VTTIGITGVSGLLARHVRARLLTMKDASAIKLANRATFSSISRLEQFVGSADSIIHLAGINRPDAEEEYHYNVRLAERLVAACRAANRAPHIVYANSIHSETQSPYGESKRKAAEIFLRWASQSGAGFTDVVLPHVFGEGGRPFYNSVVATFCYQLSKGMDPEIANDSLLELKHAQAVADVLLDLASRASHECSQVRVAGEEMMVTELRDRLTDFDSSYRSLCLPNLKSMVDLNLFNTYRAFLFPSHYPVLLQKHEDERGYLVESIRTLGGGQAFYSVSRPEMERGNHFHLHKLERFLVLLGSAVIRVRDVLSSEVYAFEVSGEQPAYVDIPTLHTHPIQNIGQHELLTIFWSSQLFDEGNTDTYPLRVS
jgi:UDP-2-acetamido-2,6-beta-L-arabino-hexul-4-ose reductase